MSSVLTQNVSFRVGFNLVFRFELQYRNDITLFKPIILSKNVDYWSTGGDALSYYAVKLNLYQSSIFILVLLTAAK